MPKFKLPKQERISDKAEIEALFAHGESFFDYPFKVLYLIKPFEEKPELAFGIAVPKKKRRAAHDRNQIKRWVREAYRLNKHKLKLCLTNENKELRFFLVFLGKEGVSFSDIQDKIIRIFDRFEALIRTNQDEQTTLP